MLGRTIQTVGVILQTPLHRQWSALHSEERNVQDLLFHPEFGAGGWQHLKVEILKFYRDLVISSLFVK